jgi:hypothetical protein
MPFRMSQRADGATVLRETAGPVSQAEFIIQFADGREIGFGPGTTDTDQSYIRLRNEAGVNSYIDVTGTTVAASATRP